jgi:hypothetical protein
MTRNLVERQGGGNATAVAEHGTAVTHVGNIEQIQNEQN